MPRGAILLLHQRQGDPAHPLGGGVFTSLRDFNRYRRPIGLLVIGLVLAASRIENPNVAPGPSLGAAQRRP